MQSLEFFFYIKKTNNLKLNNFLKKKLFLEYNINLTKVTNKEQYNSYLTSIDSNKLFYKGTLLTDQLNLNEFLNMLKMIKKTFKINLFLFMVIANKNKVMYVNSKILDNFSILQSTEKNKYLLLFFLYYFQKNNFLKLFFYLLFKNNPLIIFKSILKLQSLLTVHLKKIIQLIFIYKIFSQIK